MRVRVEIRKEHIKGALRGSLWSCVLALALKDLLGEPVSVSVSGWRRLSEGDANFTYHDLPKGAQRLVQRFDDGAEIKPCSLFLHIPEEVLHAHHG
jgi:hypothetical protein